MPGENLTRKEAQERAASISTDSYDVKLDLTTGPETFLSTTTVRFAATPGASTFIDAITRTVHSVTLNGVELDPAAVSDGVRIQLAGLAAENELTVVADAIYTNTGEGLHRFVDPVDGEVYLYSQFEVPDSRRMFAVFEQPDLKATFTFTVTAPEAWKVVSNSPTPTPVADGQGSATWTFAPTKVLSSYVTALIAGPYESIHSELTSRDGRIIPLGVYVRASLAEFMDADYVFEKTRQGFAFYEEKFDYPYPFDKYDQLFVPEFNAGAMENAGAITFTETYVFRSKVTDAIRERRVVTILHELAHMWFGDLVTMTWWNDLWLNESFAEYASTVATADATEWTEAWVTFAAMEKSWAYEQDQLPTTHPIVASITDLEDVQVNFDGITYAKGGSVLKQLSAWVGEDAFLAGVAQYFKKHEFGNTELSDLLTELEETSGRDLRSWSKLWLETAGVNTLRSAIAEDADGTITEFAILQEASPEWPTLRPHRLAVGVYEFAGESLVRTRRIELDVDGERTEVPDLVGTKRPALILINDDDLAYAKIRLDPVSLLTATDHLAAIESPLARALILSAAWDGVRDGELSARDFVKLVLANIGTETESTTLRTSLRQLAVAATAYTTPARQQETKESTASALWSLALAAEPGSDAQFQFVKSFAALASTNEHLDSVAALRDGSTSLPGLDVDADLSWELLTSLVAGGKADRAVIDAAHASDKTNSGDQFAAQAAAAIPTAEGKRAAWSSVFDSDTAANTIVRYTGLGFQRGYDTSVLAEFIPKYFDALQEVWDSRSFTIAKYLIGGMYPAALANEALRDATVAWLDSNPGSVALRRLVVENLAEIEHALRAQARDGDE